MESTVKCCTCNKEYELLAIEKYDLKPNCEKGWECPDCQFNSLWNN